jgi:hypothetical protein
MLQVFYLDVAYVAVVIHICCKCMFQLFHLVSICCSRCYSPRGLTCGHTRAARTRPVLPIFVIRASSNSWKCTQRTIRARMAEHSQVKLHARMTQNHAPLHHQAWSPMVGTQPESTRVCVLCSHPLSRMQLSAPHAHALSCKRSSSMRRPSSSRRGTRSTRVGAVAAVRSGRSNPADAAARVDPAATAKWDAKHAGRHSSTRSRVSGGARASERPASGMAQ